MADTPDAGWSAENNQLAREAGFESWHHWIEHLELHTKDGRPRVRHRKICGARVRGGIEGRSDSGTPCCLLAGASSTGSTPKPTGHKGHGRCGSHGGLTLVHPEASRSKYATTGRLSELDRIQENELAVVREIRVLELLIAIDLERLPEDVVTPRVLVQVLSNLTEAIELADRSGDYATVKRLATALREGLSGVNLYWQVMDQVRRNIDLKRKTVDTHTRQVAREHGPVNWLDVSMIMEEMRRDVRVIIDEFIDDPTKRSAAIKMLQSQIRPGPGPHLA